MDSLVQQFKDIFFSLLQFILGRSNSNVQDHGGASTDTEKPRLNTTVPEMGGFTEVRTRGATLVGASSPPPAQTN